MVLIPGPKKLIHLYVDFQSERTRSGRSSAVFGHDDQRVSLEFLPVEVAFNDEVETRIGDVEGDVEHVTDVARFDAVVSRSELAEILKEWNFEET